MVWARMHSAGAAATAGAVRRRAAHELWPAAGRDRARGGAARAVGGRRTAASDRRAEDLCRPLQACAGLIDQTCQPVLNGGSMGVFPWRPGVHRPRGGRRDTAVWLPGPPRCPGALPLLPDSPRRFCRSPAGGSRSRSPTPPTASSPGARSAAQRTTHSPRPSTRPSSAKRSRGASTGPASAKPASTRSAGCTATTPDAVTPVSDNAGRSLTRQRPKQHQLRWHQPHNPCPGFGVKARSRPTEWPSIRHSSGRDPRSSGCSARAGRSSRTKIAAFPSS